MPHRSGVVDPGVQNEALEYAVLTAAGGAPSALQMQEWATRVVSRHGVRASMDMPSFKQLEEKLQLRNVWGNNTTPAMQTLECIQKVKSALSQKEKEDEISSTTFVSILLIVAMLAIAFFIWELSHRPARLAGQAL